MFLLASVQLLLASLLLGPPASFDGLTFTSVSPEPFFECLLHPDRQKEGKPCPQKHSPLESESSLAILPCPPASASSCALTSVSSLLGAVKSADLSFGPALNLSPWAGHHASVGSNFLLSAGSFLLSVVLCGTADRTSPNTCSGCLASPCPPRHLFTVTPLSDPASVLLPGPPLLA